MLHICVLFLIDSAFPRVIQLHTCLVPISVSSFFQFPPCHDVSTPPRHLILPLTMLPLPPYRIAILYHLLFSSASRFPHMISHSFLSLFTITHILPLSFTTPYFFYPHHPYHLFLYLTSNILQCLLCSPALSCLSSIPSPAFYSVRYHLYHPAFTYSLWSFLYSTSNPFRHLLYNPAYIILLPSLHSTFNLLLCPPYHILYDSAVTHSLLSFV